jgi:hypothetical protein
VGDAPASVGASRTGSLDQGHVLEEVRSILAELNRENEESQAEADLLSQARSSFVNTFKAMCRDVARPAVQAVADQLKAAGRDGLVEEFPGGQPRVSTPRLTLWMSFKGAIVGDPRPDRHPYVQLGADLEHHTVRLSERDMWQGAGGGRSGSAGTWNVLGDHLWRRARRGARSHPTRCFAFSPALNFEASRIQSPEPRLE